MTSTRKSEFMRKKGIGIISFFINAYQDYLAARLLLQNNMLVQGCILANTSIEKYFKGMKGIVGDPIPRHHDITLMDSRIL